MVTPATHFNPNETLRSNSWDPHEAANGCSFRIGQHNKSVCVCPFEHVQVQHARTWGPVVMCRPGLFLFFNPWSDLFASGHKAILLLLSATEGGLPAPNPHKAKNCFTSRTFRVPSLRKTAPREATCTRFDRLGRPIWYSTGINSGYRNQTFHQLGFEWGVANFAKKVFRCFSGEPFMTG